MKPSCLKPSLLTGLLVGLLAGSTTAAEPTGSDPVVPPPPIELTPPPSPVPESEPEPSPEREPIRIMLAPMAEPQPALKYRLTYSPLELRSGNAAGVYNKVAIELERDGADPEGLSVLWSTVPWDEFPRERVRLLLEERAWVMGEIKRAARMRSVDWHFPLDERDVFEIRMPEIHPLRSMGDHLATDARLAMVEGRYDDAIESLRAGIALGRHVAQSPSIIIGLVGRGIAQSMAHELQNLIQQPGAPNLYWALSGLPQPTVEMGESHETEMHLLEVFFPELAEFRTGSGSAEAAAGIFDHLSMFVAPLLVEGRSWRQRYSDPAESRAILKAWAEKEDRRARRELIESGFPAEEVEAMPLAQVVILWDYRNHLAVRDDYLKWILLPAEERRAFRERIDELPRALSPETATPLERFAAKLFISPGSEFTGALAADHYIARLRLFEALRLHAAETGGGLPASLDEITVVPVPADPSTGEPFRYRLEDGIAVVEVSRFPGYRTDQRYEIHMAP